MKKSKFTKPIAGVISVITILTLIGTVGALNGWFGGGGKIPEDTFTRGLVAYWSFDEGSGNTAYDASGNGNHGTLINGPKWTSGKVGQALQFDGWNDYVNLGNVLHLKKDMSIEAWITFAPNSTSAHRTVVQKGDGAYEQYRLFWHSSGSLSFWRVGTNGAEYKADYVFSPEINKWYHVVAISLGNKLQLWVNGELKKETTWIGEAVDSNYEVWVGGNSYTNSMYWNGLIDEVRIYNRALSPEEIRFHYSRGGPVAYWKFDEGQGTKVYDLSGNGNNGTLNLGTSGNTDPSKAWVPGKFGTALSFDGVDDYVGVPNSASLNLSEQTIEFWFTPPSGSGYNWQFPYMRKNDATTRNYYIYGARPGEAIVYEIRDPSNNYHSLVGNKTNYEIGKWYHFAGTYKPTTGEWKIFINGQLDAQKIEIFTPGTNNASVIIGGSLFNGLIDEVRIYNRALSEEEIRYLYNRGAPIAHWKFDEGKGNIAYDSSGNGNNGTLVNGPTWVPGKFASALRFDGVDDYVDVKSSDSIPITGNNPRTVELWVKIPSWIDHLTLFEWGTRATRQEFAVWTYPTLGQFILNTWNDDYVFTASNYKNGEWNHMVFRYDGASTIDAWVNGIYQGYHTLADKLNTTKTDLWIGSLIGGGNYFRGLIDDVRIYNYARTPEQILQDYNAGLSTHFK
jgi:hypothetical protein